MFLRILALGAALLGGADAEAPPRLGYRNEVAPEHQLGAIDAGSPGFDLRGNSYVRAGHWLTVSSAGKVISRLDLSQMAAKAINFDLFHKEGSWDGKWDQSFLVDTAVTSDAAGRIYTIITPRYSNLADAALLWSGDQGKTWKAIGLASRNATMEKPDGFNASNGPPTILSYERYGGYAGNRLWLNPIVATENQVRALPAILISTRSNLAGNHSGAGNSTFTTKDKILIVYDTVDQNGPGTLSVARQYDRATNSMEGGEVAIGRSTTELTADLHDIPAITMGPDNLAAVVIGAHHAQFRYFVAKKPDSSISGFIEGDTIGERKENGKPGSYSYVSLNTSRNGVMNIIARSEGNNYFYELVQLRKPLGKPWQTWPNGLIHRVIAHPNRQSYVAWRQRVTMDQQGRLYLNFRYYENALTLGEAASLGVVKNATKDCARGRCWYADAPEIGATTLVSSDDGVNWK